MELKNCQECGRIFTYINNKLCPACREQDDRDFVKVKKFLEEHPRIGIFELAEATEVEELKIVRWVREDRIQGKNFSGLSVPCESCGRPIEKGRYCGKCANDLIQGFNSGSEEKSNTNDASHRPKFHTRF